MKKNRGTKRTLAVILSAALAFSPAITAAAAPAEELSETEEVIESSVNEEIEETDDSFEDAADETAEDDDSSDADNDTDADDDTDSDEEESDVEETENDDESEDDGELPLFELVDPEEEGLEEVSGLFDVEEADIPVEEVDPDEQTRVIIVLEGDGVIDQGYDTDNIAINGAALSLSENIIEQQEQTIEKISYEALDGAELDVNYNFSIITNAISADVPYKDIEAIKEVDGVEAVYVASLYEPLTSEADPNLVTAGDMVGSHTTWATGYTGAGTRIAVIDTGIDSDHPSFDGAAFDAHLAETAESAGKSVSDYNLLDASEIESVLPYLNAYQRNDHINADKLYLSDKIPFAFNYVDKDLDVTHDNDDEGDHGTHVSGIATANAYVPDSSAETGYSQQSEGVVGIAPDAQLITMKVFGKLGGAYSDDYMAAIEDAILLNADVVNLSLGSSAAGYSSDSESYINGIFDKLQGSSTVVSISAGNSGRWADDSTYGVNLSKDVNQDTVGSPGSYTNAFTVASAVNSGYTGSYFAFGDMNVFYSDGNDTLAPEFSSLDISGDGSGTDYNFVLLDSIGDETDYDDIDVEGKIVFVRRGSITFGQKQMNAEAAGAIACVVYNNTAGTITMTLQGSTAVIPCVSITLADALAIADGSDEIAEGVYAGTIRTTTSVATDYEAADGYTMSTFSSFGVPSSLDLKPEITAPGGNIYSSVDGGYGNMSGTSMAAPSIAGQTALVEQYIKDNDLAAKTGLPIRTLAQSLMMSTAAPLHEGNDPAANEYTPRSQGAGLANAYNAVSSPAYILVGDKEGNDGKVKAVLGDDPSKSGNYSFSFDIYNISDQPQYYELDSSVLTEELYDAGWTTYFEGDAHRLSPAVSLSASNNKLVYDINGDGSVNKKDRKTFLQAVNGTADVAILSEREDWFDFNNDGIVDTADVYIFGKAVKGGDSGIDLARSVVEVTDSTRIDVNINLSDSDREYLAGFENGIYVDGFIYVKGNVDLSLPFLAFYGSWMDSDMFEDFDFMRYVHEPDYDPMTYTGISATNFLSFYPQGSYEYEEYYYYPNLYADDDEYIPDRNAISFRNGTYLGCQYYSLIRNASRVILTVKDQETDEIYYQSTEEENYAAFIHNSEWHNYLQWQNISWVGRDADGEYLPEGTKFDIILEAVPSYYDDVEDPSTLDGKGLYLSTPMTIDDTAPLVTDAYKNDEGEFNITLFDNRYTAAALVIGRDKSTILGRYTVNQQTPEEDVTITIDAPDDVFYVELFDYACNSAVYRFNNTGHADTKYVTDISVDTEELTLEVGESCFVNATLSPAWLEEGYDVIWWRTNSKAVSVNQLGQIIAKSEGTATVTAYTIATDKKGNHLTATIEVTVVGKGKKNSTDADSEELDENSVDKSSDENISEESDAEILTDVDEETDEEAADDNTKNKEDKPEKKDKETKEETKDESKDDESKDKESKDKESKDEDSKGDSEVSDDTNADEDTGSDDAEGGAR